MSSAKTIVELRQLLSAKFPGVRMSAGPSNAPADRWPTGMPALDEVLEGGLPRNGVTELVAPPSGGGSALVIGSVIRAAHERGEWLGLIDGCDSFDPVDFANEELRRVLWVRCRNVKESLKAADILLRDGNLQTVVLDLALSLPADWRGVSASVWHRFHRLVESHHTALLIISPQATVAHCTARIFLDRAFGIEALDHDRAELETRVQPRMEQPVALAAS